MIISVKNHTDSGLSDYNGQGEVGGARVPSR
jgi:hypothetical protein